LEPEDLNQCWRRFFSAVLNQAFLDIRHGDELAEYWLRQSLLAKLLLDQLGLISLDLDQAIRNVKTAKRVTLRQIEL
jgi:hypothetical protein